MTDSAPAPHTHRVTLLIAIAGIITAGYAVWRADNTRDREDDTRDRVQQLENANTALHAELNASIERETKARSELQKQWQQMATLPQQVKDLTASQEDLRARTERPQRAWSRAEALYLIELAQRRLNFDRDVATASAALESADARLAALHDPSLTAARERIAKDIQALRAVSEPDRAGVIAQLTAIETQSAGLPLKGLLVGQRTTIASATAEQSIWQRFTAAIGNTLRELFSVRHLESGRGAIVTLEEQALRRQHFSLLAFAARHAVLRSDQAAYQAALGEMRTLLTQYFDDAHATQAIEKELDALRAIDIAPALPDVSGAAQLLGRVASATTQ